MATASAALKVALETSAGGLKLVATGELDLYTAPTLMRPVQRLLRLGGRRVYVDLRGVTFVDLAGLRSLMSSRERGGERVVIVPSVAVERIVDRAVAAIAQPPACAAAAARRSRKNWEEGTLEFPRFRGHLSPPEAHLEDFIGVPFHPFTDHNATVLPWHDCEPMYYTPPGEGSMSFSTLSVPIDPTAPCTGPVGVDFTSSMDNCPAIRDYYDFIRYTQSTQGHLNSQGLCYIDRQFPSPPGGS